MTAPMTTLNKYGEWIFRLIIFLAICANLYLTQSFVSRNDFNSTITALENKAVLEQKENSSAHLLIQTSIADMATTMKMMAINQTRVDDHEARLRFVEKNQIDVLARLSILERERDKKTP